MMANYLNKNYWYLWCAFTVSTLGTYLSLVVINLFIYQTTGSPFLVGFFLLLRLIPAFFIGNIASVLADTLERKRLMVIADFARAVLIGCIPLFKNFIYPLYFVIIGISMFDRLYQASMGGSIPNIAGGNNLMKANSTLTCGRTIALILGPILGGLLTATNLYSLAFIIDACTYLFSAYMILKMKANFHNSEIPRPKVTILNGLKTAYSIISTRSTLLSVVLIRCVDAFGASSINVGLPIFATKLGKFSPGICYGLMIASFGIGEMLGAISMGESKMLKSKKPEILIGYGILVMAITFGLSLSISNLYYALFFIFLCGIGEGLTVVTYNTVIQSHPDEVRGRIVGISETGVWGCMGVGMFLSGLAAEKFRISLVVQTYAIFIIFCSIIYLIWWKLRPQKTSNT